MVVLVSWPMDVEAWADRAPTDWAGREIRDRQETEMLDWLSGRILARRLKAAWASEAPAGDVVAAIDVSNVGRDKLIHDDGRAHTFNYGGPIDQWTWRFGQFIMTHIDIHSWRGTGEGDGRVREVGTQLVVAAPEATVKKIRDLVKALGNARPGVPIIDSEGCTVVGLDAWDNGPAWWVSLGRELRALVLRSVVERTACPHIWTDNKSGVAAIEFEGRLLILGPSDIRARSRTVLEAVQAGKPARLGPFSAPNAAGYAPTEHVAIWPLGDVLQAVGALTIEEIARRNVKAGRFNALTSDPLNKGEATGNAMMSAQEAHKSLYSWLNTQTKSSPGSAQFVMVKDLAVLWTTRPEIIDHVETLLRETAGPRPGN
ncbi:MAG: hypothetical protein AABZ53_12195 [Planctomycetota bacterium]